MIFDLFGWIGMILVLLAYALLSMNKVTNGKLYQVINFIAAVFMAIGVFPKDAWFSFALQVIWAAIAIISFINIVKKEDGDKDNENIKREKLKLVIPTDEYKQQVMEYRKIFLDNNEHLAGCEGLEECDTFEEWIDFENRQSKKYGEGYVPSKVYLAVRMSDNKLIGIIDIRLKLSDFLYNYGGNIGYSVLPEERKKGYAKEMLKLVLERCKEENIDRVLITCDKNNIASSRTILDNGGVLENEVEDVPKLGKSGIVQRYWIDIN